MPMLLPPPPGPGPFVLGMDMGGTHFRGVLLDLAGNAGKVGRMEVPETVPDRIRLPVQIALASGAGAIGLAVAGVVENGVVGASVNLGLADVDFGALLNTPGVPAVVVNDAVAAGVAEARYVDPTGAGLTLYLSVGTGIGGALIQGGEPVHGTRRAVGEVGHVVIDPHGPRCGCGRTGCWETFCGGRALAAAAAPGTIDELVARDDPAWIRAVEMFALGLDNLCVALAPDLIVLGGGVMARRGPVAEAYLAVTRTLRWGRGIDVTTAALGDDAGVIGAAQLASRLLAPLDA